MESSRERKQVMASLFAALPGGTVGRRTQSPISAVCLGQGACKTTTMSFANRSQSDLCVPARLPHFDRFSTDLQTQRVGRFVIERLGLCMRGDRSHHFDHERAPENRR
jgi:hypothetical protein